MTQNHQRLSEPFKTTPLRTLQNVRKCLRTFRKFRINSEPITTLKKASDLPTTSKDTSKCLRTVQIRSEPKTMPQNTSENLRTPQKDKECCGFFRNLSESFRTLWNASEHARTAENVIQKRFRTSLNSQNVSKCLTTPSERERMPLNVQE